MDDGKNESSRFEVFGTLNPELLFAPGWSGLFGLSGLSGLFGLSGFLVEPNQPDKPKKPDEPDQPDKQNKPDEPDKQSASARRTAPYPLHSCFFEVRGFIVPAHQTMVS